MMEDAKPLVVINCLTFNHKPYIRECLEGFVMQKTNFKFVAIVHDDASTDGTATIIKEYAEKYPDIIKPIFETENQYSKKDGSLTSIINEAVYATGAKYVAMCEGDDYWIDPYKLQKQVDFMEENKQYVLCCHRYLILENDSSTFDKDYINELFIKEPNGFSFTNKENFEYWITKTMTLLIRVSAYKKLFKLKNRLDVYFNYYLLKHGLGYCLPFIGAVYRKHIGGVSSSLVYVEKKLFTYMVFTDLYLENIDDPDLLNHILKIHNHIEFILKKSLYVSDFKYMKISLIQRFFKMEYKLNGLYSAMKMLIKCLLLFFHIKHINNG